MKRNIICEMTSIDCNTLENIINKSDIKELNKLRRSCPETKMNVGWVKSGVDALKSKDMPLFKNSTETRKIHFKYGGKYYAVKNNYSSFQNKWELEGSRILFDMYKRYKQLGVDVSGEDVSLLSDAPGYNNYIENQNNSQKTTQPNNNAANGQTTTTQQTTQPVKIQQNSQPRELTEYDKKTIINAIENLIKYGGDASKLIEQAKNLGIDVSKYTGQKTTTTQPQSNNQTTTTTQPTKTQNDVWKSTKDLLKGNQHANSVTNFINGGQPNSGNLQESREMKKLRSIIRECARKELRHML